MFGGEVFGVRYWLYVVWLLDDGGEFERDYAIFFLRIFIASVRGEFWYIYLVSDVFEVDWVKDDWVWSVDL